MAAASSVSLCGRASTTDRSLAPPSGLGERSDAANLHAGVASNSSLPIGSAARSRRASSTGEQFRTEGPDTDDLGPDRLNPASTRRAPMDRRTPRIARLCVMLSEHQHHSDDLHPSGQAQGLACALTAELRSQPTRPASTVQPSGGTTLPVPHESPVLASIRSACHDRDGRRCVCRLKDDGLSTDTRAIASSA